jgi:predicted transcriptional regulator
MILSEDEALARLENPNNLVNVLKNQVKNTVTIMEVPHGGRKEGDKAIPPRVRELLGILTVESGETQKEIASVFGVSQVTVSDISKGLIGDRLDEDLAIKIDKTKEEKRATAHDLALDALVGSLNAVGKHVANIDNPHKAASIATQMSKVISNLEDKDKPADVANVKVILMAPVQKQERHYETIDV